MYILLQKRLFVNICENKERCNFINAELRQKSHRNSVYADSHKNPFDRKSPATCGSSLRSSMQVGVLFCLRIFHDFASLHFSLRFFTGFCIYALFLAWFSTRSIKWGGILLKTKCKRHCGETNLF